MRSARSRGRRPFDFSLSRRGAAACKTVVPSILQSLCACRAGLIKDSTIMTIERPIFPQTRRAFVNTIAALPIAAAVPAATARIPDAELIELGARFEPLVDRYYRAQRNWTGSSAQAREDADDDLSYIHDEMHPLANAINAASVTSVEGLRVKALVALWEVAPLCLTDTEFSFEDAFSFQQLFTAVAELCGLKEKLAATGYRLPDIGLAYDDSEDDDDGEAEDA
jgi:hypothetical protein